jgi:hypothetical protein
MLIFRAKFFIPRVAWPLPFFGAMHTQRDRSPILPDTLLRPLARVTGLLVAVLLLGVTDPPLATAAEPPRPPAAAPKVDSPIRVLIDRAGFRVECHDARPADVLRALGARSGVVVIVEGELPGRITRTFTAPSVEAAVREVIRGYPTALVFDSDRAIRVIALGSAPGDGAPASPSAITSPAEAGRARAAADEAAPGEDPDDGVSEDEAEHHHRSALGESAPGARRQPGGTPNSAGRPGAAPASPQRTPGPRLAAGDRKGPAGDKKGSGQAQAFRAELMDTLMRAIRPSIATDRPRTDGQAR